MKILTFQARRFRWKSYSKTLEDAIDEEVEDSVEDAVVAFLHAEERDVEPEQDARVFRHTLKHIKWIANKRDLRQVVLHSFTHLGARNADPDYARTLIERLAERLGTTGYEVRTTPFGWFCEWDLAVYGESLAKVWKEI